MRRFSLVLAGFALTLGAATSAGAQAVRGGFVNTPMPRGDNNYAPTDYGFDINYHGFISDAGLVCTNGYIVLNLFVPSQPNCAFPGPLSGTPTAPNLAGLRDFYGNVLAPFYSNLNTNLPGSGEVLFGNGLVNGNLAWAATWNNVRGTPGGTGATGSTVFFQAVLISLNELGDFTLEFNYNDLAWAAEGGIGFVSDNPNSVVTLANTRPQNSRFTCDFIGGEVNLQQCSLTTVTPEPASLVLLGSGLVGIFGIGSYRRRRAAPAV